MSKFENDPSQRSGNTLVCDYSVNDLNQLLIQSNEQHEETEHNSLNTSPGKVSTGDKYNQLTKLDDDEENVDFMQMFSQYHNSAEAKANHQYLMQQQQEQERLQLLG